MFGRGVIASIYGWALERAGHEVEFFVRAGRAASYGDAIRLDLIDVNGEVGGYLPPTREELKLFRDTLDVALRQPVARRYSGGKDIDAACGMLAAKSAERAAQL